MVPKRLYVLGFRQPTYLLSTVETFHLTIPRLCQVASSSARCSVSDARLAGNRRGCQRSWRVFELKFGFSSHPSMRMRHETKLTGLGTAAQTFNRITNLGGY